MLIYESSSENAWCVESLQIILRLEHKYIL